MDDHLLRLAWAFPLVLAIGAFALWVLKKWGKLPTNAPGAAPSVTSVTALSEQTRLIVVQHRDQEFLLVESTAGHLQCLVPDGQTALSKRTAPWGMRPTVASN